jgi:Zinc finger, C3HC4 type (RING finger)
MQPQTPAHVATSPVASSSIRGPPPLSRQPTFAPPEDQSNIRTSVNKTEMYKYLIRVATADDTLTTKQQALLDEVALEYGISKAEQHRVESELGLDQKQLEQMRMVGAAPRPTSVSKQGGCRLCHTGEAEVAVLDCGHLCLCEECSESPTKCPVCQKRIRSRLRVYRP